MTLFNIKELSDPANRSYFPVKYFDDPVFDLTVFRIADQLILDYRGGYWDYLLINNTPVFVLNLEGISLTNFSGETFEDVDKLLAGMIVTLYAVNLANELQPEDWKADLYYEIRDLIYDYAESIGATETAFRMLD